LDELNGLLDDAKEALTANLGEIERLQGIIDDPDTNENERGSAQYDIGVARDETEGLRDARTEAQNNVNPVLLAQGEDDYYIKKGYEYVAFENLEKAEGQLERSKAGRDHAEEELLHAEEVLAAAEYDLELVRNVENYDRVQDARANRDHLNEEAKTYREEVEQLEGDVPSLKEDLENAKNEREAQA